MIASHDSYTYQSPINILLNLISPWWRCQKLDIQQQYDLGVRVFDIRIYRKDDKWGTAHGLAKFKKSFKTISDICEYFKLNYPNTILRIYLEDKLNNKDDLKELFKNEAKDAFFNYKEMIWEIGTHYPWTAYYKNTYFNPKIKDYYCRLFNWNTDKSFKENIKNFEITSCSLPLYAKKHNPEITQEMINDETTMHVLDYIGIYPKNKGND